MMIFIDGADGSGKSTLISELSEKYAVVRIPRGVNQKLYWNKLRMSACVLTLVFDRSPLTEIVYRSVDGKHAEFDIEDCLTWIKGEKIIICDTDTSFSDAHKRGEDNITDEAKHTLIRDRYHCLADILMMSGYDVYFYDWHNQSVDEILDFIGGN